VARIVVYPEPSDEWSAWARGLWSSKPYAANPFVLGFNHKLPRHRDTLEAIRSKLVSLADNAVHNWLERRPEFQDLERGPEQAA
jgi:hypothetical protein